MAYHNATQVTFVIIAPKDRVEEGDRIFRSHAAWLAATHTREGDDALLSYTVSKAPQASSPLDPNSPATGNMCFIVSEVYPTPAAVAKHIQKAIEEWQDFPAFGEWLSRCEVAGAPAAPVIHSLW